jgi:hypothetical protein
VLNIKEYYFKSKKIKNFIKSRSMRLSCGHGTGQDAPCIFVHCGYSGRTQASEILVSFKRIVIIQSIEEDK